jgi:hypothetical protein
MVGLLSVMGDYTDIQTLALVARCSNKAHIAITPLLNKKMESRAERNKLFSRLFPGASVLNLKSFGNADYYSMLLNRYFVTCSVPHQAEVTHWVGKMLDGYEDHTIDNQYAVTDVMKAMKSAEGRRRILVAVREWGVVITQKRGNPGTIEKRLLLDRLNNNVRYDFCCKGSDQDKIHTCFYSK